MTRHGDIYQICLSDDTGVQLACGGNDKPNERPVVAGHEKPGDKPAAAAVADAVIDSDPVLAAIDGFHSAAFSPRVSLTQADLNSLDGSTVRVDADEVLKGVLGP